MIRINPTHIALKEYIEKLLLSKRVVVPMTEWSSYHIIDTPMVKKAEATFYDHGVHYHIVTSRTEPSLQPKDESSMASNESSQPYFERIVIQVSVPGWKSQGIDKIAVPIIQMTMMGNDILLLDMNHPSEVQGCCDQSSSSLENATGNYLSARGQDKLKKQLYVPKYDFILCFLTRQEHSSDDVDAKENEDERKNASKTMDLISNRLSNLRSIIFSPSIREACSRVIDSKHVLPLYFTPLEKSESQVFSYTIPMLEGYERDTDPNEKSICTVFCHIDRVTITFAVCISDEVDRAIATLILQQMVTTTGGSFMQTCNLKDAPYCEYRRANDPPKEFIMSHKAMFVPKVSSSSSPTKSVDKCSPTAVKEKSAGIYKSLGDQGVSISTKTNKACAGFLSISFESRHISQENRRESAIACILMFMPYLTHHVRVCKSHMSQRMRKYSTALDMMRMPPIEHKSFKE